jgi:hypothetical protein
MTARNDHIKRGLKASYATKTVGKKLEVFCVSNKMYKKYRSGGNEYLVGLSGIPELQNFCRLAAADSRLAEARHQVASIQGLVLSMQIWAESVNKRQEHESQIASGTMEKAHKELSQLVGQVLVSYVYDMIFR